VKVPFLDLSRKVASLRPELDRAIASTLDEGPFVFGPALERFEAAFAEYCGAGHAIGVASGTDAITIALQAVGVHAGDEVITTSNSGVPTVAAITAAGAVPVLVDVEPVSMTIDPERLDAAASRKTRAIVAVHLYGQCADVEPLLAFARPRGIKVVEDAAQATGAEYRGGRAGSLADAAAFSFYPTKNLGAFGDGGAVVTSDAAAAGRARLLRHYGEDRRYHSILPGRNSRLDPLQAALLHAQLSHVNAWNERRRQIAAYYDVELSGTGIALPAAVEGGRHVYHLYVVRSPDRDTLQEALAGRGVGTLVHYPIAVHHQPAYQQLARPGLEVGERLCAEVLSLPLYPELTDAEAEAVVEAIRASSR
jgi:dTDP-3-amino-3,4,6-trideoxy-alpha-D-glucose transaminase